jgi:hypothetical protein
MNASNSGMRVVNSKNANQNIQNKEREYFSESNLKKAKTQNSGFRIFYYIDRDGNIIGFINLRIVNIDYKQQFLKNLSGIIRDKIVYELSIVIFEQFRRREYTSDFLEKILDQIINKEDAIIFFIPVNSLNSVPKNTDPKNIDNIENSIVKKIYTSKKINENFDVYIILDSKNGEYLIGKKTSDLIKPQYLELKNRDKMKQILLQKKNNKFLSQNAIKHINTYLTNHPEKRQANS